MEIISKSCQKDLECTSPRRVWYDGIVIKKWQSSKNNCKNKLIYSTQFKANRVFCASPSHPGQCNNQLAYVYNARNLNDAGLHGRIPEKIILTKKHRQPRFNYDNAHFNMLETSWKNILWSNETKLMIVWEERRRYVWRLHNTSS